MSDEDEPRYRRPELPVEERVADLLDRMTVAEKAGQVVGTWVGPLDHRRNDLADVEAAIRDHHLGAATPFGWGGAPARDVESAVEAVNRLQRCAVEDTRLGIPLLMSVDAIHGNAYVAGATVFPHGLGAAATWDPDLVEAAADATATEVRRLGAHRTYSPTCDVARDPRWGRAYETFGESPHLCARLAAAKVRGYQGSERGRQGEGFASDAVAATAKHFPAYGDPVRGEDASPVDVSAYTLRNVFLPPFEAAVEAGVASVMPSYSAVGGEPPHGSRAYLTDLLRGDLGFDGSVVSDWNGVRQLAEDHGTALDRRDAVGQSRRAGLDVASVGHAGHAERLADLVRAGDLDEESLDESVRRVLRLKFELGAFEDPYADATEAREALGRDDHRRTARELVRESLTLLKNDGLLPLAGDEDVFVGGPSADDPTHHLGGWSVDDPESVRGDTVLDAIADRTSGEVAHEQGATLGETLDLDAAVEQAADADVAVLALGEGWYLHEFGPAARAGVATGEWPTRSELGLSDTQRDLARRVHATGTPVVAVLLAGRPLAVDWLDRNVPAILLAYYPGTEGGRAVAETLFGDNEPSGRLPVTVPRSAGDLPQRFDRLAHPRPVGDDEHPDSYDPLYEFGHGLSYTAFEYEAFEVESADRDDGVEVSVTVRNAGKRSGTETVQVFARQETSSRVRPRRTLVGFERVGLDPGETATVSLSIPAERFGFYRPPDGRVVESGTYRVLVADLASSFELD